MNDGKLIIISSPSGGGKDTVIAALLKKFTNSAKLITTTTRLPNRQGDQNGVTYYFVDKNTFEEKIKNQELIEHNFYAGNYYGVEKKELLDKLKKFDIVFSNVDVHGRRHLSQAGFKNLSIFLTPDNLQTLEKRIRGRSSVSETELKSRIATAQSEIESAAEYDFQITNKDGELSKTIDNVAKIIKNYI